jgi:hypothetical protein
VGAFQDAELDRRNRYCDTSNSEVLSGHGENDES